MKADCEILHDATNTAGNLMPDSQVLQLLGVQFKSPGTLLLAFKDRSFELLIEKLGMPLDRIRWNASASIADGSGMAVKALKGETITIDSGTLRYLVDSDYAAKTEAALAKIRMSDEELEELSRKSPPPQHWYDQPEDLRLESWK